MNILQQEDIIKGLPDDALMQEAQAPSGQVPQFLVVSEVQRRADMRKRYQEQQQPQGTVAEQIVGEAQQGIAAMQQQGGPMPPQAMPPQGMPPQGMPPQGMPPQGMPPQQMFGGGIIRLQGGGFLDQQTVSGAGTVKSQIDQAIASGATAADLLSIFKNQPDAIQYIQQITGGKVAADKIGSQFNYFQPPEFLGDVVQAGIGAMPEVGVTGLPQRSPETVAADRARVASIREGISPLSEGISPLSEGISPLGTYGSTPEEFADQRGRIPDLGIAGFISDMRERGAQSLDEAAPNRQFIADLLSGELQYQPESVGRKKSRSASAERMAGIAPESLESEPAFLSDLMSYQDSMFPELSEAIRQAQGNPNDAAAGATGQAQRQGLTDAARQGQTAGSSLNLPDFAGAGATDATGVSASSPSLDLSDLIADSKRMSQANALMQLGAGIAGGDLSKGLSAAGTAASRGAQDARKIAISQRLAEYNAGREDLSREEKTRQFDAQLEVMKDRVKAYERAGVAGVDSATIRATQAELQSLRETFGIDPKDPRIVALESRLFQLLNVDPNSAPTVTQGQSTAGYRVVRGQAQG